MTMNDLAIVMVALGLLVLAFIWFIWRFNRAISYAHWMFVKGDPHSCTYKCSKCGHRVTITSIREELPTRCPHCKAVTNMYIM